MSGLLGSCRLLVAVAIFQGLFLHYTLRFQLSVAIVCMVKKPQIDVNYTIVEVTTSANTTDEPFGECGLNDDTGKAPFGYQGEFEWDRRMVGHIIASYYYSYVLIQVPSGWLSDRYGGKHVFGTGMLVSGVASLLIPVATRIHYGLLIALRLLMGIGTGVTFPTSHSLMGRWLPPNERSRLFGIALSGSSLGTVAAMWITGQLCTVELDNGWPFAFYLFGGLTVLWWVWWQYTIYSTPEEHPRITTEEKQYIMEALGRTEQKQSTQKHPRIPWRGILTSMAVWGIVAAHISQGFMGYTIMGTIPLFMQDVLKFNVKQNGFVSALPILLQVIMTFFIGWLADYIIIRRILSRGVTRKLMQGIANVGPLIGLLTLSFLECEQRTLAVGMLCFATVAMSGSKVGYQINPADIAPRFAGVVYGISNTISNCCGFLVPVVVGILTPNGTREEWQKVFFICVGMASAGFLMYSVFAKGEEQGWAKVKGTSPVVVTIVQDEDEKDPEEKQSFI